MAPAATAAAAAAPGGHADVVPERVAAARRIERRFGWAMTLAHTGGAIDVFILLWWALPTPTGVDIEGQLVPNLIALAVYLPLATLVGMVRGNRMSPMRRDWFLTGRPPTAAERDAALRVPMECTRTDGGLWLGGLVLFTAINAPASADLANHVAMTVVIGAITVIAVAYLLAERLNRPVVAAALEGNPPAMGCGPGVKGRLLLAWICATGAPLLGIVLVGIHGMAESTSGAEMARAMVVLGCLAGFSGLLAMVVAAKSVSEPVGSVRRALARVEAGDLSAEVVVNDATEIGLLQAGFNRMAAGLREREQLRELYTRQVGEDVARHSLDGVPQLGGERKDVAVLFVDIIGSTRMAHGRSPEQVVAALNGFFSLVVDVIHEHGGWVNKFEGDAALCVFGAPAKLADPAGGALGAARALDLRLRSELDGLDAGIGLSAGEAVAGWVGAEQRFEYTVIGDPVNEAARLCELAKRREERVLASETILRASRNGEASHWRLGEEAVLRGRTLPTRLAAPLR